MRIYNRQDFLKLPAGTVYCYAPEQWNFGGITVKDDSLGNDWFELSVDQIESKDSGEHFARMDEMLRDGTSYPIEETVCRNGCFEDKAVFLVYERGDLEILKRRIEAAAELAG